MTTDHPQAALDAHEEYRAAGYETIPIRLDRITDDRGQPKKRPRFPGGGWQAAREVAATPAQLWKAVEDGFTDVALVCGPVAALDFDARDGETVEDVRERAREVVRQYGLREAVVEETARGIHILTRAPAENGKPWRKRALGPPHLIDEIQVGEGALLFVDPSWHPVAEKRYQRLTDLRPVDELPELPRDLLEEPEAEGPPADAPRLRDRPRLRERGSGLWSSLDVVGLFREAGMYRKDLGGGKHGVRCPWESEHTTGSDGTDTSVWEGDATKGPGFKCLHAHCEGRDIRDVRSFFGAEAVDRWCRETFEPEPGPVTRPDSRQEPRKEVSEVEPPTLTDSGNSSRLVRRHGERLHFIPKWGKWVSCDADDAFWALDHNDVRVRELAKDVGRELKMEAAKEPDEARAKKLFSWGLNSLNSHRIGSMVNLARGIGDIPLDHEKLDADGWLLGVENGVVELRTGKLRPARPDDLITRRCPVEWDEDATCPRWEQAMKEWHPDPEQRAYVQRVDGAALVGGQRDHAFLIQFGGGGNGKGTHNTIVQHVLGPYAMVIHLSLLVDTNRTEHDTVKAQLFRARLALASETERRVKLDEASVKNLTGGDRITARRMREDPWEFDPTHSLWLQTNHLPEINGRDEGIWRRIRVVKWENTFKGKDEDPDLKDKLRAEAPGILRWLVEGCLEWQEHGLQEPEAVIRETLAYRNAEDTFTRFAADMGLVFSRDLKFGAGDMQDLLQDWANADGIDPPRRELGDWLKENGARQTRERYTDADGKRRQRRVWQGVGIADGNHQTEQTDAL